MNHLQAISKVANNAPSIRQWISRLQLLLQAAMTDVRITLFRYAEFVKSSPMMYLLLANRTKDFFEINNIFSFAKGVWKTAEQSHASMSLFQMARLYQVN
jgi:DNA polymerase III delta subunit